MQIPTPLHGSHPGDFEFHISRDARVKYQFRDSIYTLNGNVILADFRAARLFAMQMNAYRSPDAAPVRAGDINAMGIIDEILHLVVGMYKQQVNPQVMSEALDWLNSRIDPQAVDQALGSFAAQFPALAVFRGKQSLKDYFIDQTDGVPNKLIILEEMLMLWLANANPAFSPYQELFNDLALSVAPGAT